MIKDRGAQNPVDAAAASQRGIRGERRRQRPEDADDRKTSRRSCGVFVSRRLEVFSDPLLIGFAFAADCPGTQSEAAGKAEACAGRPNQQVCSKGRCREDVQ
jgi:hypothetical protein